MVPHDSNNFLLDEDIFGSWKRITCLCLTTLLSYSYVIWTFFSSSQVAGTICLLFILSPELAPILGFLMLAVSTFVGIICRFNYFSLSLNFLDL